MIGLVTELARQQQAAAQKGADRRYTVVTDDDGNEVILDENGKRVSPLQAAEAEKSVGAQVQFNAPGMAGMSAPGPVSQALATHGVNRHQLYPQQQPAPAPVPLAGLQTIAAPSVSGPTFAPGTATVQSQNHRAVTPNAFPQVHAPGQPAFHPAPLSPGSH